MNRLLKIMEYALATLIRRGMKNFSIIVVFAFTIGSLASILFLTHSLRMVATEILQESPAIVVQRLAGGRHELIPKAYADRIGELPGVGETTPRYWGYYYDAIHQANYTVMGVQATLPSLEMVQGRKLQESGECTIGAGVAQRQNGGVGDALFLINSRGIGYTCEITGVFEAEASLWTNDLILMTVGDLQSFFALPKGLATDITVQVYNPGETAVVAEKIRRMLPDTRPVMKRELLHTYEAVFNWRSGMMLTIFTASLVAFLILAWDKATGLSGEEKREIGILRAIGWSTADILTLRFLEGLVISAVAYICGLLSAYVHVFVLGAPLLVPVLKGWSVLFPDLTLVPFINGYHILVLAMLTIVPYLACTIVPAWKSAITEPDMVMRGG